MLDASYVTILLPYLQYDHIRPVLFPQPHVVHEKCEHLEGVFFAQMEQQHTRHKTQALAVAHLWV